MLSTLSERPETPEKPRIRRHRRRARRWRSRGSGSFLPMLAVGFLGVCLGAALVVGVHLVSERLPAVHFSAPKASSRFSDQSYYEDVDPEVNAEANSAYALPSYSGESSALTIDFQPRSGDPLSAAELYQRVHSAVVSLTVYAGHSAAYGSGMILTPDGFILTCAHVVEGSQSCTVSLFDGQELEAELVCQDAQTDLAVVKIDAQDLPTVTFTDSDQVVVGESVYAIGDPVRPEFRGSFTDGMVSGLNRSVNGRGGVMRLIQITTPVNSGNSGGPVFNAWGQVLGVVNMKISRPDLDVSIENMGMCIPSRTVKSVVEALVQQGRVQRTMLGISCYPLNEAQARVTGVPRGLWISSISPHSDVVNHDIRTWDIITAVNGTPVNSILQFRDATSALDPGDTVRLTIWRDDTLQERLRELEAESTAEAETGREEQDEEFVYSFYELGEVEVAMVDDSVLTDD